MLPPAPHHGHLALPFGRFYGRESVRRSAPGLEISVMQADPHRVVERHSHDDAHFVLVLDGLYVSSAVDAPPVSSGTALVFNPAGTTHRDRFEARDGRVDGRFLTLSIDAGTMDAAMHDGGRAVPQAIALTVPGALTDALRLARACQRDGGDQAMVRESLAMALLSHVVTARRAVAHDAPAWLARARACLDESLGAAVSMTAVANEAGVHPVHLARVFRRHVGLSPGDYLRRRRLEQAAVLLRESRRPITDIALACGFTDQSHLTTAFRRAHGCTPAVFRRDRR